MQFVQNFWQNSNRPLSYHTYFKSKHITSNLWVPIEIIYDQTMISNRPFSRYTDIKSKDIFYPSSATLSHPCSLMTLAVVFRPILALTWQRGLILEVTGHFFGAAEMAKLLRLVPIFHDFLCLLPFSLNAYTTYVPP